MHEPCAYLHFLCHMRQRPLARLLCYMVSKSLGCPLVSATSAIGFRERSPTRRTPKSSFVQDQIDLIPSKLDISFHPLACIMDLGTCLSTSWAGLALFSGFDMHLNAFICPHALTENREFGQIQGHDDPLIWLVLSCSLPIYAMLVWHRLSLVRLEFVFLL